LLTVSGLANADTLTLREGLDAYAGTQDTWFSHAQAGGYPTGTYLRTARRFTGDNINQQGVLRFDSIFNNDGGPIALGLGINSATLTMYVVTDILYADGEANGIHKMLVDWDETDAYGAAPWAGGATLGIDRDDVEAVSVAVDDSTEYGTPTMIATGTTMTFDVTSIVQDWSGGDGNYGFLFQSLGLAGGNGVFMASSEYAGADVRPTLTVDFVPEPITLALFGLGGLGVLRRKRR